MFVISRRDFAFALAGCAGMGAASASRGNTLRLVESGTSSGSITEVPGIKVGHYTDSRRPTGCTAMVFDGEVTAGVDYDGSAPGETQVVLLQPTSPIETIHAILFTGGGPMGLAAVAGVVRYLEERKIGFDWGVRDVRVPIVVGAVIDDLSVAGGKGFADIVETMKSRLAQKGPSAALEFYDPPLRSTTIGVVATNVAFNKTQLTKIAMMANAGAARVIRPYHTTGDGDQLFALSTNKLKADVGVTVMGSLMAEVLSEAILRAIKTASSVEGWPAARDYPSGDS